MVCVNCGISQIDDIKLEGCDGCQSVSYCNDKCQENRRKQHEGECKQRKAELHDKELFQAARRQSSRRVSDLFFAVVA